MKERNEVPAKYRNVIDMYAETLKSQLECMELTKQYLTTMKSKKFKQEDLIYVDQEMVRLREPFLKKFYKLQSEINKLTKGIARRYD